MNWFFVMLSDYLKTLGWQFSVSVLVLWVFGLAAVAVAFGLFLRFQGQKRLFLLTLAFVLPDLLYRPVTGFSDSAFTIGKILFWAVILALLVLLVLLIKELAFSSGASIGQRISGGLIVLFRIVPILFHRILLLIGNSTGLLRYAQEISFLYMVLLPIPYLLLIWLLVCRLRALNLRQQETKSRKKVPSSYWSDGV